MKKPNTLLFLGAMVTLLALCNIALLAIVWRNTTNQRMPPPPPHTTEGSPRDFLVHELNFNERQQHAYDSLIGLHQMAMDSLEHKALELRAKLYEHVDQANVESGPTLQEMAANQEAIEAVTFHHFVTVRALCTPPQAAQFDHVIREMLDRMHGRPENPPPLRRGRPPDRGMD